MPAPFDSQLIRFLEEELGLPEASISVARRYEAQSAGPLPMILWQYGLVTLEQLEQIYDWLDAI